MYVGIDLGDKRCGIAVSVESIAFPKGIFPRVALINEIKKLVREYDITTIVVGLPYDLYGTDKKQLYKTQNFIEKLKNIFPHIHIDAIDERFTSFEADEVLFQSGKKGDYKDDIAAVLILESYLKMKKV